MIKIKDKPLQVVTASDEKYLPYLACHLLSIGERSSATESLEITVIHKEIPESEQLQLKDLIPDHHRLHWVKPDTDLLRSIGAPLKFATLSPHYFRLLAPFLLCDHDRAVYLDADTLVLDDISSLWHIDLEGHAVAAVRDYLPCMRNAVTNWEELRLNPNAPYFNSGVMIMDLARWRADEISERVVSTCQKNRDYLLAQQKWPQHDQYGLNVVIHGQWKAIDRMWNHGADLAPSTAKIVHYVGNGKAGLPTCQPFFNELFFDALDRTPYRGCHPPH